MSDMATVGAGPIDPDPAATPREDSPEEKVLAVLRDLPVFSALDQRDLVYVASQLQVRRCAAGDTIIQEGSQGTAIYIIVRGLAEVRRRDAHTEIEGLLGTLQAGAVFGEMGLLSQRPSSATVRAVEPTKLWYLPRSAFWDLVISRPLVAISLSRTLAERLSATNAHVGIRYQNLWSQLPDAETVSLLPHNVLLQHRIVPVAVQGRILTLAMVDPNNLIALDDVRRYVKGLAIEQVIITAEEFRRFMAEVYPALSESVDRRAGQEEEEALAALESQLLDTVKGVELSSSDDVEPELSALELVTSAEEAPVVRMVNGLVALAITKGASDIHIEPQDKNVLVRFRIDGELVVAQTLPKRVQLPLISRLKIIANLDISERRLPQDGRFSVRQDGKAVDVRLNSIPTKYGEKIVMRLLDKSGITLEFDRLILHPAALTWAREIIQQPYGLVLVCGPTGSGKTTTLYAGLAELNKPNVNIVTAEDPVEYDMERVNQVQVQRDVGLDYATILRALLRQDPDVLLVGEIRDGETAKIAVEASLTGHLVLSTLHTNNAATAFIRLKEMGVDYFMMASACLGIIAQRLVRRICTRCKVTYHPEPATLQYLMQRFQTLPSAFYRGTGCAACNGAGFRGRVGVYEVMKLNNHLRSLIAQGSDPNHLHREALKQGMIDLGGYALYLLEHGETTLEEILSAIVATE